jgi:hypothetical protein
LECSFHDKPVKNPELIHTVCEKRANSNEGLRLKQIILSKLSTKILKTL